MLDQHLDVVPSASSGSVGAVRSRSQYGECSRNCPYRDRYRLAGATCVADSMQYALSGSPCAGIHRWVVPRGRMTKSPVRTWSVPNTVSTTPAPAST